MGIPDAVVRVVRNKNFDHEWNDELTREVQSFHIANIAGQKLAVIQRIIRANGIIKIIP